MRRVLARLRSRQASYSTTDYHLLGHDDAQIEKRDDTETSVSDVDSYDLRPYPEQRSRWRVEGVILRLLRSLKILLPSFLHASEPKNDVRKLRPTAWLDGLRGVAALCVVLHHMSLIWFSWSIHDGWQWPTPSTAPESPSRSLLIQLPLVRLFISGPANVMLFFAVSGYALSLKPLTLMRSGEISKAYQSLASATFRRHPRLFLPPLFICAPAALVAFWGGYDPGAIPVSWTAGGSEDTAGGEGLAIEGMIPNAAIHPMNPPRFDTFAAQLTDFLHTLLARADPYTPDGGPWAYSDSLWTLPIEFRGSLVIFALLFAVAKCTRRARLVITGAVAVYSWWFFHWGEFLFVAGVLVAEVGVGRGQRLAQPQQRQRQHLGVWREDENDSERESGELTTVHRGKKRFTSLNIPRVLRRLNRVAGILAFIAALFVLSMPEQSRGASDSWGFEALNTLIPERFHAAAAADSFWQPLAAIAVVLAVDLSPLVQSVFTTRFALYLGRISFALYLVHMLILHSLGFRLGLYVLTEITGYDTPLRYGMGVGIAGVVTGFVIFWAADLGARFVDENVVRFTGWAYSSLCTKESD
ncbi:acyltransferase family-domain-containing protein [Xylariaceae sp. FL0255]|nr:acyltransferase family-domain-containing protein [Xylariaceae sp. FL0255]